MNLILVGYVPEHAQRAVAHCERTLAGLPIERRLLVANSRDAARIALPPGWAAIRGSNTDGEFSGWQEGLAWLDGQRSKGAVVVANDTFGNYRHLSALRRWAFRQEICRVGDAGIVGFADQDAAPSGALSIRGLPLPNWLSSYILYLPEAILERLGGHIYDPRQVTACVAGGADETHFFTGDVSPDLQRHLRWWMFHGGWRKSEPLTAETAAAFAFKARCICAELLLAARVHALGYQLRDALHRHPVAAKLEAVNAWRQRDLRPTPSQA